MLIFHHAEDYYTENGGIIIPNPNAPTSICKPLDFVINIVEHNPDSVVIIDEAYVDFGGESAVELTKKYENLLVTQTFSKSRSLAGMRIGFAIGSEELIATLETVKNSYNSYVMDSIALEVGTASVNDEEYFKECVNKVIATRERVRDELIALGFDVKKSAYIEVLGMIRDYFDDYLEFEKVKSEKGYFMSDDVCDEVIKQCEDFLKNKDDHFMIQTFNDNIESLSFLTEDEIQDFEEQNKKAVAESLLPAFQDVIDVLTSLKGTGKNDGGLCNYEGGKEYYTYLLQDAAGTDKTPDEVAEMLDENLSQLITEMTSIAMTDYSAYEYLYSNYDNLFSEYNDADPTEIINKLMGTATDHYPDMGKISYTAKKLDKSLEDIQENTLAYYMSPAIDDQDNNLIRVNGKHTDGMWTTLAHEGYPGHMLQNAYYMSTDPEPIRTVLSFLGYKEGWAMYACYDAISYYTFDGVDNSEDVARLYQINDELNYLVCGRIDIGINYEGWSVQDAKDYLNGKGLNGDAAEELYTTMVGDPAVYQSYSTGYYEMQSIRNYAEKELGSKFDLKEFNTVILETGPCQFNILKEQVDKYISTKK